MGSRIMHLIIGSKIAESIHCIDKPSFLLGSIAADAVFSNEEKNLSHFFIGEVKDYSRRVDFDGFLRKYSSYIENKNNYILGYYTHLIADDIWLRGFNLSWLKNRMDTDEGLYKLYQNDFKLLNGKLLEYYSLTEELRNTILNNSQIENLDEVNSESVEKLLPKVLEDMQYDMDVMNEKLSVFTFNQVVGYIETSIELGLLKLKQILT